MKESSTHTATKRSSVARNPKTNDQECKINGKFIGEKREEKKNWEFYIQILTTQPQQ